jgi:hypothetical protein
MEDLDLISQLKALKEIKPRENWVVFTKSKILSSERKESINWNLSPRLAYVFALLFFVVVGIFSFPGNAPIDNQAVIKKNVVALSNVVNDLVKQGKTESVINGIKTNALELARNLNANPADPEIMKGAALSLKTLADISGVDLSLDSDIENLYQTVVKNQITDLEKSTLTEDQQKSLVQIKDLFDQGKYADALEKILLINS